jgi:small-conductance mechanosensitive channel
MAMNSKLLFIALVVLVFAAFAVAQDRGSNLNCYECVARAGNNNCTEKARKKTNNTGFEWRCRLMEMDGKVVSQGRVANIRIFIRIFVNYSNNFLTDYFTNTYLFF